jgi:hypothetical protein
MSNMWRTSADQVGLDRTVGGVPYGVNVSLKSVVQSRCPARITFGRAIGRRSTRSPERSSQRSPVGVWPGRQAGVGPTDAGTLGLVWAASSGAIERIVGPGRTKTYGPG